MSVTVHECSDLTTPYKLGMFIRGVRDKMFPDPKHQKNVCVGWHDNLVRVCDDDGAIDYTLRPDGRWSRVAHPGYNRRIESVDRIVDGVVIEHNWRISQSAC